MHLYSLGQTWLNLKYTLNQQTYNSRRKISTVCVSYIPVKKLVGCCGGWARGVAGCGVVCCGVVARGCGGPIRGGKGTWGLASRSVRVMGAGMEVGSRRWPDGQAQAQPGQWQVGLHGHGPCKGLGISVGVGMGTGIAWA